MKSIIIYFSLTGNTKKVAQAIHKGMNKVDYQCDLANIREVDPRQLISYDLIGFGSPVWGGVPPNVRAFISRLPFLEGKHAISFSTHGAMPDRFFPEIINLLVKKGFGIIGIRDWYGSVNLPGHPKPYPTDGHPDEIDLKEAETFGKAMLELSLSISNGVSRFDPELQNIPVPPPVNVPRPRPVLKFQDCRFPECRLCVDNCPQDAIDLTLSPPVLAKDCRPCYFCEMICPEGAIEADYELLTKDRSWRVKNEFERALKKAEVEGRFRRLVPPEEVGWDTPFYKRYNKHPRYVIPKE
ncbi:flavodoxin family protein [Thermodesulfobacteriota bacterium]